MKTVLWFLTLLFSLVLLSCSSNEDTCKTGEEKCDCYPNGTCNRGLQCRSNLCVNLSDDGGDSIDSSDEGDDRKDSRDDHDDSIDLYDDEGDIIDTGDDGGDSIDSSDAGEDSSVGTTGSNEDECVPNCENADCGDDGCGDSCGECSGYESCEERLCISEYEEECDDLVDRIIEYGHQVIGKSYDQLLDECKQQWTEFYQCLYDCHVSNEGYSQYFVCARECGGGSSKEAICGEIVENIYDICNAMELVFPDYGSFFSWSDGVKLTRQEAYDKCVSDFTEPFLCAFNCETGDTCPVFWSCLHNNNCYATWDADGRGTAGTGGSGGTGGAGGTGDAGGNGGFGGSGYMDGGY